MKRDSVIYYGISIICIVVLITIFGGLLSRVQAASTATQWDYAQMIYITKDSSVVWAEIDSDEQKLIRENFVDFKAALKVDAIPSIYYLNIVGRYGWELVTEHDDNSGSSFILKRVHE